MDAFVSRNDYCQPSARISTVLSSSEESEAFFAYDQGFQQNSSYEKSTCEDQNERNARSLLPEQEGIRGQDQRLSGSREYRVQRMGFSVSDLAYLASSSMDLLTLSGLLQMEMDVA